MKKVLFKYSGLILLAFLMVIFTPFILFSQNESINWLDRTITIKELLAVLGIPTVLSLYSIWKYYKESNKSIAEKAKEVVQKEFAKEINLHKDLLVQIWDKEKLETRLLEEKKILVIGPDKDSIDRFIRDRTFDTPFQQNNLEPKVYNSENPFKIQSDLAIFCFEYPMITDNEGNRIPSEVALNYLNLVKGLIASELNKGKYFVWFVKGSTTFYHDQLTYANSPATLFNRSLEIMKFYELKNKKK